MNKTEKKRRLREFDKLTKVEVGDQDDLIPEDIWVGAMPYRVEQQRLTSDVHLGHCDSGKLAILIHPEQAQPRKRETLLHEVLHAIVEHCGLAIGGEDLITITHEDLVGRLAPVLNDVLRTNRDLTFYLMSHTDP